MKKLSKRKALELMKEHDAEWIGIDGRKSERRRILVFDYEPVLFSFMHDVWNICEQNGRWVGHIPHKAPKMPIKWSRFELEKHFAEKDKRKEDNKEISKLLNIETYCSENSCTRCPFDGIALCGTTEGSFKITYVSDEITYVPYNG